MSNFLQNTEGNQLNLLKPAMGLKFRLWPRSCFQIYRVTCRCQVQSKPLKICFSMSGARKANTESTSRLLRVADGLLGSWSPEGRAPALRLTYTCAWGSPRFPDLPSARARPVCALALAATLLGPGTLPRGLVYPSLVSVRAQHSSARTSYNPPPALL